MKKKILFVIIFLAVISNFTFVASASNIDEFGEGIYESSGANELMEYLDRDSREFLESIGLDEIEPDKILDFSPSALFSAILNVVKEKWKKPLTAFVGATGTAMFVVICGSLAPDDEKSRSVISIIGSCFAILTVFKSAYESIKACVSCLKMLIGFEKLLIPVLTLLLSLSGKPAVAISYNGLSLAISEFFSLLSEQAIIPLSAVTCALYLCSGMISEIKLGSVADALRKFSACILSISAALFSGTIAIKNTVACSTDAVSAKAIMLVSSTLVPIVGGSLSQAYSSFAGSIGLIYKTVGIFGIAALGAICIPIMIQSLLWIFSMRFAQSVSDMFSCQCCSSVYNGIAYMFSMMNTMLIMNVAVFVISCATVILTGG